MVIKFACSTAVVLLLLHPARLIAGGPPWLSLPIDGVTADNAEACAALLTRKLDDKLWPHAGREPGVKIQVHEDQWYLTLYLGKHMGLNDIEAALAGSGFSIPRDRLRLFGHVTLAIDAATAPKELLADLEALQHVSVAGSNVEEGRILITVDMPYPTFEAGRDRQSVGWESFQRCDFSSDQATRSEPPTTAQALPGHAAFREIVEKYGVSLKDIRWSAYDGCRPLGCAVAPAEGSK